MDALSSSVSSLNIPTIQSSTSRELYRFKILNPSLHHLSPNPHLSSAKKSNSIISKRPTILARKNSIPPPLIPTSQTQYLKRPPTVHRNAATGYAAALIDAARCKNSLASVERDVKRLSELLRNKQLRAVIINEEEREMVVKEVVEKGGFERHLVALLKMLVKRNKLGMVKGVLDEFQRIYEELLISGHLVYDC